MTSERIRVAREALEEITRPADVGELLGEEVGDDGLVTLEFQARMLGYPGWRWTVAVAELDGEAPSVLEAELLPGAGALLAPDWVPWSVRLEEYQAQLAAQAEQEQTVEDTDDGFVDAEDADDLAAADVDDELDEDEDEDELEDELEDEQDDDELDDELDEDQDDADDADADPDDFDEDDLDEERDDHGIDLGDPEDGDDPTEG